MSNDCADRAEIAEVVRRWIADGKIVGEELSAIVLEHEGSSDPVDTIHARSIPKDETSQETDELIERIAVSLERDAGGFKGVYQQYYIVRRQAGAMRGGGRLPVGLSIDRTEKRGRTVKPTVDGAFDLVLRAVAKVADQGHDATQRSLAKAERDVAAADKRAADGLVREENMRNELMMVRAQLDKLMTEEELRRANREAAEARAKMVHELFTDIKTYLPILANRMAGDNVVPIGELAPEQRLLREFVRQLDGPKAKAAMEMLLTMNPNVALMFAELVQTVQGEDVRRADIRTAAQSVAAEARKQLGPDAPPPKGAPAPAAPLNGSPLAKQLEGVTGERGAAMVPR